jgi:hypothetical protein
MRFKITLYNTKLITKILLSSIIVGADIGVLYIFSVVIIKLNDHEPYLNLFIIHLSRPRASFRAQCKPEFTLSNAQ